MLQKWQTGNVIRVEQAAPNTRRYWLELPETPDFNFKPGQFVTLDLPIHEQRNKRWRSYSIASTPTPNGSNIIELIIVDMGTSSGGSAYIFKEITVGSALTLRGPQGVFVVPEQLDKDLFLICTGTGIAPFRSMLHYIQEREIAHKNIHLIFGTRTSDSLLYASEMQELQNTLSGFTYHPTLSREDWEGNKGYVHNIYERICENKPDARFMLCGWRPMIDEAKERILKLGYTSKDIDVELYG